MLPFLLVEEVDGLDEVSIGHGVKLLLCHPHHADQVPLDRSRDDGTGVKDCDCLCIVAPMRDAATEVECRFADG